MSPLNQRQQAILELARQEARVDVDRLAGRFAVSVQTIRKDLNILCDRRLLSRINSAYPVSTSTHWSEPAQEVP